MGLNALEATITSSPGCSPSIAARLQATLIISLLIKTERIYTTSTFSIATSVPANWNLPSTELLSNNMEGGPFPGNLSGIKDPDFIRKSQDLAQVMADQNGC